MKQFDAVVIGGGILGCFAARNLRRWKISTVILEKEPDVCTGITRANSAIVYSGYDNKPGTRKAEMTVRANRDFETLCRELDVPFSRCGSLLVTYDSEAVPRLEKKLRNGICSGVPGLRLLSGKEAEEMETMLKPGVVAALYAPTTGTVNPWQLGIAACENAVHNGASLRLNTQVLAIDRQREGFAIRTEQDTFFCRTVLNCAGLSAARVEEMVALPTVGLRPDSSAYLVLDDHARKPEHILFYESETGGKGITAVPCVEGNLLIGGTRTALRTPFATTPEGLRELYAATGDMLPDVDLTQVIRSFGAVRPNPHRESGESIHDFCIDNPVPGFYSLIGIKTPGLTCANELGAYLAGQVAAFLEALPNPDFDPRRKAIPKGQDQSIVCQCGQITRGEILEAVARGATTVDGVKRRVGSGMGRCQGSRCAFEIGRILETVNHGTL